MTKLLLLDCDSTLSAIEGVDELAALRGPDAQTEVEALTNAAMNGEVPIDEIFARRLDLIRPTRTMCDQVGQMYIDRMAAGCLEILTQLRAEGWHPVIISGGFTQVIAPLAEVLKIDEIHAAPLKFDNEGNYLGFNQEAPTARNGGKPEIAREILKHYPKAYSVMVGDGVSDMECQGVTNLTIGYGEFTARPAVIDSADVFVRSFAELQKALVAAASTFPS
jgi:phosphoserine phosphatase